MTILELLITMALLGIVAALALPSMMDDLGRSSARAASRGAAPYWQKGSASSSG